MLDHGPPLGLGQFGQGGGDVGQGVIGAARWYRRWYRGVGGFRNRCILSGLQIRPSVS